MRQRVLVFAGVVLFALPTFAFAQRWGRDRFPDAGACFFRNSEFRGEYFCIRAGDAVPRVPDEMNDAISSIRIFGPAEVVVFRDVRFNGGSLRLDHNASNLRDENWNDRISSMRVQLRDRRDEGRDERRGDVNDERRGRDRGPRGEDPDRIVRRAYQDVLGRDPDAAGLQQYRSRIIDDGWSEEQVRNSIRNSPEFQQVRRERALEIVRRAYRSVLNRDPDAGAEGYIQNVLRDNWSQQDVERALRNSPEFRNRR